MCYPFFFVTVTIAGSDNVFEHIFRYWTWFEPIFFRLFQMFTGIYEHCSSNNDSNLRCNDVEIRNKRWDLTWGHLNLLKMNACLRLFDYFTILSLKRTSNAYVLHIYPRIMFENVHKTIECWILNAPRNWLEWKPTPTVMTSSCCLSAKFTLKLKT